MPKLQMTDAAIQRVTAAPGERVDWFDAHKRDRVAGLVLRATGSRDQDGKTKVTRTWSVMCRVRGSTKVRRFTIGDYPATSLADARRQAGKIVSEAKWAGTDPLKVRMEEKLAAEIAAKDTVQAVVDAYLAELARQPKKSGGKRSPLYIEGTRMNLDNHVLPRWGHRNIRDITRREVGDLLEAVRDGGSTAKGEDGKRRTFPGGDIAANRTLAAVRSMFNYAIRRGIVDATPVAMVEPPAPENARERTLTDEEIRAVWDAAEGMSYPFGPFFRLALILGQRRGEIASMLWADVDLAEKTWTLTAAATKAGRAHVVPLPARAVEILESLPRKSYTPAAGGVRASPFVFTSDGDVPISGFSKAKPALDRAIEKARSGNPLARWTIHDLRRTAATKMAALGTTEFVIGRVLNHAAQGVTGKHYNQYDYIAEKRTALEKWAAHLQNLTKPPGDNVVELHQADRVVA